MYAKNHDDIKTANVVCVPVDRLGEPLGVELYSEAEMSTDLPAADLGKLAADCIEKLWAAGHDPYGMTLTLVFGSK